jgi:hypothetical protein
MRIGWLGKVRVGGLKTWEGVEILFCVVEIEVYVWVYGREGQ